MRVEVVSNMINLDSDNLEFRIESDKNSNIRFRTNYGDLRVPKYAPEYGVIALKKFFKNKKNEKLQVSDGVFFIQNIYELTGEFQEIQNDIVVDEYSISPLKIMFSDKNIEKISDDPLSFVGISEDLFSTSDFSISIPFLATKKQGIVITIKDQHSNIVFVKVIDMIDVGYYVIDKAIKLPYSVESLLVSIEGINSISKRVRIVKNKKYSPINIKFRNQFGAVISCQLISEISIEEEFKNTAYKDQNENMFNSSIESSSVISVDTGYLLYSERFLITQICNSLDVRIEVNGKYENVVVSTKKITTYRSGDFLLNNKLIFTKNNYEAN